MTEFLPASRSITDIRVDATVVGAEPARVAIDWIDAAGEKQHVLRHRQAAREIITDLHACTLMGEGHRRAFLIGFIRCHTLRRGDE